MAQEDFITPKRSFETDLHELETLVAGMESGSMGLEEMVEAFEKGQKLVKNCTDRLNEVERRIEVIKRDSGTAEPLSE